MVKATENATKFAQLLNDKFGERPNRETLSIKAGRRFNKVVWQDENAQTRSVFAFIERSTGDLYKAAGYNAPANYVRYPGDNLLTLAVEDADEYGGFLYI